MTSGTCCVQGQAGRGYQISSYDEIVMRMDIACSEHVRTHATGKMLGGGGGGGGCSKKCQQSDNKLQKKKQCKPLLRIS